MHRHDELIKRVARYMQDVFGLVVFPAFQDDGPYPVDLPIARYIDHTLLKAEATPEDIVQRCHEAVRYRFASVCVHPGYVEMCAKHLIDSGIAVCTVVGFPLGATLNSVKVFEAREAIKRGATEIDMVLAIGRLKAGQYHAVYDDIASVVLACREQNTLCKVIIETSYLHDDEKVAACLLAARAQAQFVKTSTGYTNRGATVHDVALMRRTVGPNVGVKASGGVRTFEQAKQMIQAGATRIGSSSGISIVQESLTHSL
ncbi:MAG: deoxyribose-phosphate aldolase [Chloroflexaceae bacterium]|nr:deoxyribose-phosphate aldolase [Chloroflexaceae bacterium]